MKRTISFIVLLLALVMLLSACVGQPTDTTGSTEGSTTGSTKGSTTSSTEISTLNTAPETTTPTQEAQKMPAELSTAEDFKEFINNNRWYWRTLGCAFEKPEDLPAYYYFYLGIGETSQQLTAEEQAFAKDAYQKKNPNGYYDAVSDIKLPVAKINEAMSILGVTIEDIKIPDQWVYYDKTDSYYFWVSDAYGVDRWSVTKVEKGTEGIVAIYWEAQAYGTPAEEQPVPGRIVRGHKMVMTMQLQSDGTYRVLSNLPQK